MDLNIKIPLLLILAIGITAFLLKDFLPITPTQIPVTVSSPRDAYPTVANSKGTVAIVGAGISGLAAGDRLAREGYRVFVLEAKDHAGGRIESITKDGTAYQLGAGFIHGTEGDPMGDLLKDENLPPVVKKEQSIITYKDGNVIELTQDTSDFFSFVDKLKSKGQVDSSLLSALEKYTVEHKLSPEEKEDLWYQIVIDVESEVGAGLEQISLKEFQEEGGLGGANISAGNAYNNIINKLSSKLDIRYNSPIVSVKDKGDIVELRTAKGDIFTASSTVITVPLGVLKKGMIAFDPPFPKDKQAAVSRLHMGNFSKTFLVFKNKFWDNKSIIGIVKNSYVPWGEFYNLEPSLHKPILLSMHGGKSAEDISKMSKSELLESAFTALKIAYPNAEKPVDVITTNWTKDIYAAGSYPYVPVNATLSMFDDIGEPYGNIYFAGDATTSLYPSTVHGAYMTGLRAAREIFAPRRDREE